VTSFFTFLVALRKLRQNNKARGCIHYEQLFYVDLKIPRDMSRLYIVLYILIFETRTDKIISVETEHKYRSFDLIRESQQNL